MTQNLGEKIRQARREKGMTQEQLAQALFVSRQTVSNWENGRTEPDYQTLTRLKPSRRPRRKIRRKSPMKKRSFACVRG